MSFLDRVFRTLYFQPRIWFVARRTFLLWRRAAPTALSENRANATGFEARLRDRWQSGLDGLELLWLHAYEEGPRFNERYRATAAIQDDFLFDALARLHARACRVGSEVLALLRTGHADGAHARWRTLHEIAVTMFFLKGQDQRVAEAYLLHHRAHAYRVAEQYQRYHDQLGYPPYSEGEMRSMKQLRDDLVGRFWEDYDRNYGWAAEALGKRRPMFVDIEEAVQMDRWRPWYRMASEGQHAGSRGLAFILGLSQEDSKLLPGRAIWASLIRVSALLSPWRRRRSPW